jgi:hypothetical protein
MFGMSISSVSSIVSKSKKSSVPSYTLTQTTPPLVGFEHDLAFTKKDVTPRPAAIKLHEALQAIGYNGPIDIDLNMIQMYVARIAELPPNVTASFGYNVDLGQVVLQADVPRPLPCNVTFVESPKINLVNQGGGVMRINLPGVYIIQGGWTCQANGGYQMTILTVFNTETHKRIRHNIQQKIGDENIPNAFPFTFLLTVADAMIEENHSKYIEVSIRCYLSSTTRFSGGPGNYIDVAKL